MAPGSASFPELLEGWDGIGVVVRRDGPTGTWIFVALHDDALGRPVGGCRMTTYPRPEDGLRDALRLAEGMTWKWAAMDLPYGGGKSVLAVPRRLVGAERLGLLRRFGALLNALNDAYGTGEDLGTTPDDIREIARVAPGSVVGLPPEGSSRPTDPGPYTARGVLAGIRAALRHREGGAEGAAPDGDPVRGRTVLVQGVGDVGAPLARMLAEAGARPLLADVDAARATRLAEELDARTVRAAAVYDTPCDVYAPCAVGATLNPDTIPRLRCQVVAGSANNQLESADDAERLQARGVLYAPDYVVNGGGAMAFGLMALGADPGPALDARVDGIGHALAEIFEEAAERGDSPAAAARRRVERTLARARRGPGGAEVSARSDPEVADRE